MRIKLDNKLRIRYASSDASFLLVLAFFAGEASLSIFRIPITLSSSVLYLLLALIILLLFAGRQVLKCRINLAIVFCFYLMIRSLSVDNYILEHYFFPYLATTLLLLLAFWSLYKEHQIERVFNYLFFLSFIIVLAGLLKAVLIGGRTAIFGGPNGFYKIAMIAESIAYYYYLRNYEKKYLIVCAVSIAAALFSGSRASIIEVMVLVTIEMLYYIFADEKGIKYRRFRRVVWIPLFFVLVMVLYYLIFIRGMFSSNPIVNRALSLFDQDITKATSVTARFSLFRIAWEGFEKAPLFGNGSGYIYFASNYVHPYAHNLFLETLCEYGCLGAIILTIALVHYFVKIRNNLNNRYCVVCLLIIIDYLIGSLFSGNILDAKMMFFMMVIVDSSILIDRQ